MAYTLFTDPPNIPLLLPEQLPGFFIWREHIPDYAEKGIYNFQLVFISFVIVAISAYVALGIAGTLRNSTGRSRQVKLFCGALAMGAGIWAMHFIGMLAYQMPMQIEYHPGITALSMVVAVIFSGAAFIVVERENLSHRAIIIAAPLLGFSVCGMHYIGMHAMKMDAKILYRPDLFFLSFLIATTASAVALKLMSYARQSARPEIIKIGAALSMGIAVCGMHYTGMAASVMLPYANCRFVDNQEFSGLALSVTMIALLIILISFLVKQLDEAVAEVQKRTEELFQAQKMEAVGQLTGGIAHDFNNMLSVVIGTLELLSRTPKMPERAQLFIKTGLESANKASELTQRLLTFSRKQSLRPVPTNLDELIPPALTLIGRAIGPEISIQSDIPNNLPPVFIDPVHLESALLNLAINARDAMPHGGTILIKANIAEIKKAQASKLQLLPNRYIAITVKDSGHGMSEEVKARAMEPFFTTKDIGKGSGMGLSMVAGFARQSNGDIRIESQLDHGTSVIIYLPISEKMVQRAPAARSEAIVAKNERVLVVDDQQPILTYLEAALTDLGYKPKTTTNPEEALAMIQKEKFHLLITDVMMPQLSGYKLCENALLLQPGLKTLFISGYTNKEKIPDTFLPNCYAFLAKPFSLDSLAQSIHKLLRSENSA